MRRSPVAILIIVAIIIIANGLYIVDETKQVIITQFGKPVGEAITSAGLKFKLPFIQKANFFEKRVLEWDGEPKQIPTSDKKYLWVDTFARWRIDDPLLFFQTMRDENSAHGRLDDIISGTTRDIISLNLLIEVVRNSNRTMEFTEDYDPSLDEVIRAEIMHGRSGIADNILEQSKPAVAKYGIELIDVRIKRVNYIDDVRRKVFERMISERQKIAAKYRSAGQGKAAEVLGKMQRELDQIQSEAYRTAQEVKGRADAKATALYAKSYSKDPEFYRFMKTLETYEKTIKKDDTLILSTDGDYFKYLKKGK